MLTDRIQNDLTTAMKAREELTVAVLRSVLAAVKEAQVAGVEARELDDAEVEVVLAREAKKREEAATAFADAGRTEQAERERAEGAVLARYLPERMGETEVRATVERVVAEGGFSSPADMGAAMKAAMTAVAGRADGKVVSALVKAHLTGS